MFKKVLVLAIATSYLCFIAPSCGFNEPCICENYEDISTEMKGYVDFEEGDYWVYFLEENNAIKDTLTCTRKRILENGCTRDDVISPDIDPCTKVYELNLTHSNLSFFPHHIVNPATLGVEVITVENFPGHIDFKLLRDLQNKDSYKSMFNTPFYDPSEVTQGNVARKAMIVDTLSLNDSTHTNVLLSHLVDLPQTSRELDSVYFKSGIGIISYKNEPNQKWVLEKFVTQ